MDYNGIEFELGVRQSTGLAANFHRLDADLDQAMRDVVERGAELIRDVTRSLVPVDTGFMRDHVTIHRSPGGRVAEVGWRAEDFIDAGLAFYPVFVEFGTRMMAARPSLGPAYEYAVPIIQEETRDILRAAISRIAA